MKKVSEREVLRPVADRRGNGRRSETEKDEDDEGEREIQKKENRRLLTRLKKKFTVNF